MAIRATDLPGVLIERIEAAHPRSAYFGIDETDEWPAGALTALLAQGVLAQTDRADVITCPGCEEQCRKPVDVRQVGRKRRARIICDEEPNLGPIPVPLRALERFVTDVGRIGLAVARGLNLPPPEGSRSLTAYMLGLARGRHGDRRVYIAVEDGQLVLGVGTQLEPLLRCIALADLGVVVDEAHVLRLANRKEAASSPRSTRAPDRSKQAKRKADTRRRNSAIYREAKRRLGRPGVKVSHVAAILANTEYAHGLSVGSLRRIITEERGRERKNSRSQRGLRK